MGIAYNTSIVRDGLVLHLDAANVKSYPGRTRQELVTNSLLTSIDGNTFNVFRTSESQQSLSLCPVTANKYYIVTYVITSYPGTTSATFRINGSGANLTPGIGINSVGTFTKTFQATASGTLGIVGDNVGTDFEVDYVSVKELVNTTGTTWSDMINSVSGTMNGGLAYTSAELGAMDFDGTDDYCEFSLNGGVNVAAGTTICAWVYRESASTAQKNIISTRFGGGGGQLYIGSKNNQIFSYYNNLSTQAYVATSWPRLKHVYFIVRLNDDGSITHISYSDAGREENTSPIRTGYLTGDNNTLKFSSDLEYFEGKMYSVQWYNRELSNNEIQQNFEAMRGRYVI